MDEAIISAEPENLIAYGNRAVTIDETLTAEGHKLAASLSAFEAGCTEPGFSLSLSHLGGELSSYGQSCIPGDERVRQTGLGFLRADNLAAGAIIGTVATVASPAVIAPALRFASLLNVPSWLRAQIARLPWVLGSRTIQSTPVSVPTAIINGSTPSPTTGQGEEKPSATTTTRITNLEDARTHHFNQVEALGRGNADCGPASLIMALEILRLPIGKNKDATSPRYSALIAMREAMVSDSKRDGFNKEGEVDFGEHGTYTNFEDIKRGAEDSGAAYTPLVPTIKNIENALNSGGLAIVSGTFADLNGRALDPLPWKSDRERDIIGKDKDGNNIYGAPGEEDGVTREHVISVVGMTEEGQFIVNDPARDSPIIVDAASLELFMSGNPGAAKISRRN